jgi:hypothetical protein
MIPENASPATMGHAPAPDIESATARTGDLIHESLLGLVGAKFKDMIQFRQAMKDSGWVVTPHEFMKTPMAITFLADAISSRNGAKWKVLVHLYGSDASLEIEVINMKQVDKGEEQPTLKEEPPPETVEQIIARLERENAAKTPEQGLPSVPN